MDSFVDSDVWREGIRLVKETYTLARRLPKEEQYGLISQMQRAVVSILANFAEGFSRSSAADKAHKYTISRGECSELEALFLICSELGHFQNDEITKTLELTRKMGKMFSGLIKAYSVKKNSQPQP
jgi:four helix bundle protein